MIEQEVITMLSQYIAIGFARATFKTRVEDLDDNEKFALAFQAGCEIEFDYETHKYKTKYPVGFTWMGNHWKVTERK